MVKFAYAFQTTETKKQLLSAKGDPEEVMKKLADIGYDAVELLVRDPKKSEFGHLMKIMERNNLETASLGTGPMAADDGLAFCSADNTIRKEAVKRIFELIRWSAEFRSTINIGKLRGNIDENNHEESWKFMTHSFETVLEEAHKYDVKILIEPQNETQINSLNTTGETIEFIDKLDSSHLGVMLDLFHLESEDKTNAELIKDVSHKLGYIHLSDSERAVPGQGVFNIREFINIINDINKELFVGLEIKQEDNQVETANTAYQVLKHYS